MTDITNEFLSIVAALPPPLPSLKSNAVSSVTTLSEFHGVSSSIAKEIHTVSQKLSQLTRLVQNRGLFNDPAHEINELVHNIKEDIQGLNSKLDAAQSYVESKKSKITGGPKGQYATHSNTIVGQLKVELMHATKKFKDVLQVRSSKLKEQAERKDMFFNKKSAINLGKPVVYKPLSAPTPFTEGNFLGDSQLKRDVQTDALPRPWNTLGFENENSEESVSVPLIQPVQQQVQLIPEQSYLESRSSAMQEVEAHIMELGTVFNRLATMLQDQRELVENVHDNVDMAESNVNRGQIALLNTLRSLQSNRILAAKVSGILLFFVLFFVIFMA